MQLQEAKKLRDQWRDAPCNHPHFAKEYDGSSNTGDYVCTQCGKTFTEKQKENFEANRDKKDY
jgi:transposase-like protein